MEWIIVLALVGVLVGGIVHYAQMSPSEREELALARQWGSLNPVLLCPHCQERGHVRTKDLKRKKGISGGKATAAILTGGISMLATGLSRKEATTQAHCQHCSSTWDF